MTDKRIIELLAKRYPRIYAEILDSDVGKVDERVIEIALFFAHILEHRTNVFICSCLLVYSPNTINHDSRVTHGLVAKMAQVKGVSKSAISQRIPEAVFHYKKYKEVAESTNNIVERLKNIVWEKKQI